MSDIRRSTPYPSRPAAAGEPAAPEGGAFEQRSYQRGGSPWLGRIFLLIIIVAAVAIAVRWAPWSRVPGSGTWQAVFLSSNTVYFGHAKVEGDWVVLRDIFYLQRASTPQPPSEQQSDEQGRLQLIKLGNELHGPEDLMRINLDHVVFIEDLKPSSRVVEAISRYLQGAGQ